MIDYARLSSIAGGAAVVTSVFIVASVRLLLG
jgi:hypothetical protein